MSHPVCELELLSKPLKKQLINSFVLFVPFVVQKKLSGSTTPGWPVYAGDFEVQGEDYRTIHFANAFDGAS